MFNVKAKPESGLIIYLSESLVSIINNCCSLLDLFIQFTNSLVSDCYEFPLKYKFRNCNFVNISYFFLHRFITYHDDNLAFKNLISKFYEIIY